MAKDRRRPVLRVFDVRGSLLRSLPSPRAHARTIHVNVLVIIRHTYYFKFLPRGGATGENEFTFGRIDNPVPFIQSSYNLANLILDANNQAYIGFTGAARTTKHATVVTPDSKSRSRGESGGRAGGGACTLGAGSGAGGARLEMVNWSYRYSTGPCGQAQTAELGHTHTGR